jgi:hypothetical protein
MDSPHHLTVLRYAVECRFLEGLVSLTTCHDILRRSLVTKDKNMSAAPPQMDYAELKRRVTEIRQLLSRAGATLVPGQGLEQALAEAEAIADGIKSVREGNEQSYIDSARAVASVWSFSETLRPCIARGLNLDAHLRTVTTGSLNFGVPRAPTAPPHEIFFKDFELELFVAARCINGGIAHVALNPIANDPSGDLFVESLRVEVKHPDSLGQLDRMMREFHGALRHNGMYGVFIVGLEDVFQVQPTSVFATDADWRAWLDSKAQEVEAYGATFLRLAATWTRIIATVQTWTVWYQAAGGISLHRQGNAALLDDRIGVPPQVLADAERVLALFNPNFRRWTNLKYQVPGALSDRQKGILRAALHERAFRIFEDENRQPGNALRHWLQAKDEMGVPRDFMI